MRLLDVDETNDQVHGASLSRRGICTVLETREIGRSNGRFLYKQSPFMEIIDLLISRTALSIRYIGLAWLDILL